MRLVYGTDIFNAEGDKVGELEHVVINPETKQVTHLVVRKGYLLSQDKVVPISLVMYANEEKIKLYDFEGNFDDLDNYIELHYVKSKPEDSVEAYEENLPLLYYPPTGVRGMGFVPIVRNPDGMEKKAVKNTPPSTKSIKEGSRVFGMEGEHVGDVEEVIIEPTSDRITHFVISKGIVFKDEKLIPATWVHGFDDDRLKLVVDSNIVKELPEYQR